MIATIMVFGRLNAKTKSSPLRPAREINEMVSPLIVAGC